MKWGMIVRRSSACERISESLPRGWPIQSSGLQISGDMKNKDVDMYILTQIKKKTNKYLLKMFLYPRQPGKWKPKTKQSH